MYPPHTHVVGKFCRLFDTFAYILLPDPEKMTLSCKHVSVNVVRKILTPIIWTIPGKNTRSGKRTRPGTYICMVMWSGKLWRRLLGQLWAKNARSGKRTRPGTFSVHNVMFRKNMTHISATLKKLQRFLPDLEVLIRFQLIYLPDRAVMSALL